MPPHFHFQIYLSEFGRERLREEDISGPKELKETKLDSDEDSDNEGNLEVNRTQYNWLSKIA